VRAYWREYHLLRMATGDGLYSPSQLRGIQRAIEMQLDKLDFPRGHPPPDLTDAAEATQPEPYGAMSDGTEYTLEEVGQELGVTRERIRQIEGKALWRLSRMVEVRRLWGAPAERVARPLEPVQVFWKGCRCARYSRSPRAGYVYCRLCGGVWALDEAGAQRLIDRTWLATVKVAEEPPAAPPANAVEAELIALRAEVARLRQQLQGQP
jgi:hypothetical protein